MGQLARLMFKWFCREDVGEGGSRDTGGLHSFKLPVSSRHSACRQSKMPIVPVLSGLVVCVDNLDVLILFLSTAVSHYPVEG